MHLEQLHEQHTISLLQDLGYTHLVGKDFERASSSDVILKSSLRQALSQINPNIDTHDAAQKILDLGYHDNAKFFEYFKNGINVEYLHQGETRNAIVNIFDWENPHNNIFQVVSQLTIQGSERCRPDLIIYINGLPIALLELKTPSANKNHQLMVQSYEQIQRYKKDIPQLFTFNAICVIDDGAMARIGTTTSDFSRFVPWSSINGTKQQLSNVETIVKGVFTKERIIDILRDFVFYVDNNKTKILSGWHQYFAIKKAIPATEKALTTDHKIGVLWHTQGSGKSYTMVMYSSILARDLNNPTIVILTDRNDLDDQLFQTFSNANLNNTITQAESSSHLREILNYTQSGGIIFSTLHKFTGEDGGLIPVLSTRDDIIVIADEAHRSHYGNNITLNIDSDGNQSQTYSFARQVRTALPNASFIGFTGTPIEELDKSTKDVFGENIHIYGLAQSIKDGMTVKISYYNKAVKLHLNYPILQEIDGIYEQALDDGASVENVEKSKQELSKTRILYEDPARLALMAKDLVQHFESRLQKELKGMIVCSSREAASILYDCILKERPNWKNKVHAIMTSTETDTESLKRFKTTKFQREELAKNFKDPNHEFNLAIVVDMWLTGFDVPCLGVMYLDKDLEKHNLMQTIARVNRVYPDKDGGLICDYRGIFTKLQEALRIYSNDDRECFDDYESVLNQLKTLLEKMSDFLYGVVDLDDFLDDNKSSNTFLKALDYIEGLFLTGDEKYIYYKSLSSKINQCFKICYNQVDRNNEIIIAFLIALNKKLNKLSNLGEYSTISLNKKVEELIIRVIEADDVENILSLADEGFGVDVLSPTMLDKISKLPQKNIAIKTLERLLDDKINTTKKINLSVSKKYSEKLRSILLGYENKNLTSSEVLQALLDMSDEWGAEEEYAKSKGLSSEEYAFYCAIKGETVETLLGGSDVLQKICHELVSTVQQSKTLDWHKKESIQAEMRRKIKRLLNYYKYPPDDIEDATTEIIKQAEEQEVI